MRQIINKNLRQLTFFPNIFPINMYLYEENDSLTVIDIGVKSAVKEIQEISQLLNKPVKYLLLTHAHADHVAALDDLKKAFPQIKVGISEREAQFLAGDFPVDMLEKGEKIKGGFKKVQTIPDFLISDGDQIGSLTAISTPGHTPDSMSFYDTSNKILIAGDELQTQGGLAISGDLRPSFPFPAWGTWSKKEALKSAKRLAQLDINILATGHGNMLENPDFDKIIRRFEEKLKK